MFAITNFLVGVYFITNFLVGVYFTDQKLIFEDVRVHVPLQKLFLKVFKYEN